MEQFDSSEEASSRVLEQQQRNDEQQCPSCVAELTETSVWTTAANEADCMGLTDQQGSLAVEKRSVHAGLHVSVCSGYDLCHPG